MTKVVKQSTDTQQTQTNESVVQPAQPGVAPAGDPQGDVTKQEEQSGDSTNEQAPAQKEATEPKVTEKVDPEAAEDGEIAKSQEQFDEEAHLVPDDEKSTDDGDGEEESADEEGQFQNWDDEDGPPFLPRVVGSSKHSLVSESPDDDEAADEESSDSKGAEQAGEPKPLPEVKKAEETPPPVGEKLGEPGPSAPDGETQNVDPETADPTEEQSKSPDPAATGSPSAQQEEKPDDLNKTEFAGATNDVAEKAKEPATPPNGAADEKKADTKPMEVSSAKKRKKKGEAGSKTKGEDKGKLVPYKTPGEKAKAVEEIKKLHGEILNLGRTTLEKAQRIGELLVPHKKSVGHKNWEPHVRNELGMDPKTASNYMRLYLQRDRLPESGTVPDLGIRGALKLLGKPKKNDPTKASADAADTNKAKPGGSASSPKEVLQPPKSESSGSEPGTGETSDQEPKEEKRAEETLYRLADGVGVTPSSAGWVDGVIPWLLVKQSLDQIAYEGRSSDDKSRFVRRQRKLLQIAGNFNRVTPDDSQDEDIKDSTKAIDALRKLIVEAAEQRKK